jgi:hypothetical protein
VTGALAAALLAAAAPQADGLLGEARSLRAKAERELAAGPDSLAAAAADARDCAEVAHRAALAQSGRAGGEDAGPSRPRTLTADGAEAQYLEAVCTSAWARTQGFTPLVERRAQLVAAFTRLARLAPDLDGAGAERELGALLAQLPSLGGGDLAEARRHLGAAAARAPQDPRNHLVLARTVAVKAQDRALFESELHKAAAVGDAEAQAQAAALLEREDDLFGPAQAAQPTPGGTRR